MSMSKSVGVTHAQTALQRNISTGEAPGQHHCKECGQTLCPTCEKCHRRFNKDHKVVLRSELSNTILTCAEHGNQAHSQCEKCNIPVCAKCSKKHRRHPLSSLTSVLEKEKKLLQNDITIMQHDILPELKKRRDEIIEQKNGFEIKIKQLAKDMEDENQAFLMELHRFHNERMKNLDSIQQSHLSTFDICTEEIKTKIGALEERISQSEDAIGKNSLPAVICLAKGESSLPEIGNEPGLPEHPSFIPGNAKDIVKVLGKLHVSYPSSVTKPLRQSLPRIVSKFKSPLQGYPSICITQEDDVWLAGYESKKLVMVDIRGQILRKRRLKIRPHAIAVMDCGDFILSPRKDDSTSISRLLINDRVQRIFDTSPSYSNGVSVTADQKILICSGDGGVVKTNDDGTNVRYIYKGARDSSAMHAVENADGNIYISDHIKPAVMVVSKDGSVLSTMTHTTREGELRCPLGLMVDRLGNILFADIYNHCVYIIDKNQHISMLLGREHDIQDPCWLAVDSENNLWITQRDGMVLVAKYLA